MELMSSIDARLRGPVRDCGQAAADLLLQLPWAADAPPAPPPLSAGEGGAQAALRRAASALIGGAAALGAAQGRLCDELTVAREQMYYGEKEPDEAALFGYSPSMARYHFFFCLTALCAAVRRAAHAEIEALREESSGAVAAAEEAVSAAMAGEGPAASEGVAGRGPSPDSLLRRDGPASKAQSPTGAAPASPRPAPPAPAPRSRKQRALALARSVLKTNPARLKYALKVAVVRKTGS